MKVRDHAPRNDLESRRLKWYGWTIRSQLEPVVSAFMALGIVPLFGGDEPRVIGTSAASAAARSTPRRAAHSAPSSRLRGRVSLADGPTCAGRAYAR